ncbi:hypothetical protein [Hungatella hathewayi]|uniref:hypothetical protein n=1 Tax=Hungatella hathewayi TaxID=154046 RepID=UPI0035652BA4
MKKKNIFAEIGEHCFWQPRNIPPEAKLIKMHDNVVVASEVLFVNHDVMHHMFKNIKPGKNFKLNLGAIDIMFLLAADRLYSLIRKLKTMLS